MNNEFIDTYELEQLKKLDRKSTELISRYEAIGRTIKIFLTAFLIITTSILYFRTHDIIRILWLIGAFICLYLLIHEMLVKRNINELKTTQNFLREDMGKTLVNIPQEINHFDKLVRINVNNLEEYYELVKKSNSKSFNTALIMSIVGVIIILLGVGLGITNKSNLTSLAVASGLIVEIISGLLFYLYNRTIIQLKDYHDSLINVQNVLLSFKVIEQITDEDKKSEVLKQMIDGLITRK